MQRRLSNPRPFARSLTFVRDDARFRCESCGHHGQSAQCSRIICTISIQLFFGFPTMLARGGTAWLTSALVSPAFSFFCGLLSAALRISRRAVAACVRIDPSLTTPGAIIGAVRGQPQLATALRSILSPRHPSQLYEAFFEGIVLFAILWLVRTRARQPNGVVTGLFFICYAIFRIVIEYFREPDAELIGPFTRGQFFSFFLIAIGVGFVVVAKTRPTFPRKLAQGSG